MPSFVVLAIYRSLYLFYTAIGLFPRFLIQPKMFKIKNTEPQAIEVFFCVFSESIFKIFPPKNFEWENFSTV